jgi:hypothetical protein
MHPTVKLNPVRRVIDPSVGWSLSHAVLGTFLAAKERSKLNPVRRVIDPWDLRYHAVLAIFLATQ